MLFNSWSSRAHARRILATATLLLAGCAEKTIPAEIVGINYTGTSIATFTVNDHGGANIPAHGGGASFVCCVVIPSHWKAGLAAKVRWTADDRTDDRWHEAVVPIPQYSADEASYLAVHFYENGSVKVLVTNKTYRHPAYPLPEPSR